MNAKVRRCTFKFECAKQWEELNEIRGESSIRYCGECHRGVHLCTTPEEFQHHAELGHCVAFTEGARGQIDDSLNMRLNLRVGEPLRLRLKPDPDPLKDTDVEL